MPTYFTRDVLEDAVAKHMRTISDLDLARMVSSAFNVSCHLDDPKSSHFVVYNAESSPQLSEFIAG